MSNKILLIEDNEQNRYLATFLLEKIGLFGRAGIRRRGRH